MKTLKSENGEVINNWNDLITKVLGITQEDVRTYLRYTVNKNVILDGKEVVLYKHWSHSDFSIMDGVNEICVLGFDWENGGSIICE